MAGRILTSALNAVGLALYRIGAAPLVRRLGRGSPKVLLYHDCSDSESPYLAGLDCTTSPARFAEHLAYLARFYSVVELERIVSGDAPPNAVAVTFDDGYRSVYDHAFPLLRRAEMPATIYLIADAVGNDELVWVNELNFWLRARPGQIAALARNWFGAPGDATAEAIIAHCRINYDPQRMRDLLADVRAATGGDHRAHAGAAELYVDWAQIAEMEQYGITFGNHTCTHPNMERLSEAEQAAEIIEALRKLAPHLRVVHSFAHPFGHKGSCAARVALEAGARCAVDVGGSNRPIKPLTVGRVHVSDQDVAGLFARMEVVEPVKEWLRRLIAALPRRPARA